jgi:hypothetical protein
VAHQIIKDERGTVVVFDESQVPVAVEVPEIRWLGFQTLNELQFLVLFKYRVGDKESFLRYDIDKKIFIDRPTADLMDDKQAQQLLESLPKALFSELLKNIAAPRQMLER